MSWPWERRKDNNPKDSQGKAKRDPYSGGVTGFGV